MTNEEVIKDLQEAIESLKQEILEKEDTITELLEEIEE